MFPLDLSLVLSPTEGLKWLGLICHFTRRKKYLIMPALGKTDPRKRKIILLVVRPH